MVNQYLAPRRGGHRSPGTVRWRAYRPLTAHSTSLLGTKDFRNNCTQSRGAVAQTRLKSVLTYRRTSLVAVCRASHMHQTVYEGLIVTGNVWPEMSGDAWVNRSARVEAYRKAY
jgi:hypothetical protein